MVLTESSFLVKQVTLQCDVLSIWIRDGSRDLFSVASCPFHSKNTWARFCSWQPETVVARVCVCVRAPVSNLDRD